MIGVVVVLFNAGAAALSIYTEQWYLLPINVASILVGLVIMARA